MHRMGTQMFNLTCKLVTKAVKRMWCGRNINHSVSTDGSCAPFAPDKKPFDRELRGDTENVCRVLTSIDLPPDSWHRLQDGLRRGWRGKGTTGRGCQAWLFIARETLGHKDTASATCYRWEGTLSPIPAANRFMANTISEKSGNVCHVSKPSQYIILPLIFRRECI